MTSISSANFQNRFCYALPGDTSSSLMPRQTPGVLWAAASPSPVPSPALVAWDEDVAAGLGLGNPSPGDVAILSGNAQNPGMQPFAACYGGHQFGHWAGQLGDGRAISLGELPLAKGRELVHKFNLEGSGSNWGNLAELQLKGAGPTAYSRRADGRAVLRSSVREYLMSEAMHSLGIPTTRALSLCTTGARVLRDMFYDGHPAYEAGAVVCRVAPSFLRFGSYELPAARGETALLQRLVDYTLATFFPHLQGADQVVKLFEEVSRRTAYLLAQWMRVGFVHGVMNTDNMSMLGLTIDYGPYGFLDQYDLRFTPNTTDLPGRRYAYGNQPAIAHWNLACLAGALATLLPDPAPLQEVLDLYPLWFEGYHLQCWTEKLCLDELREDDTDLIRQAENMLVAVAPDYTMFFQELMQSWEENNVCTERLEPALYGSLTPEATLVLEKFLKAWEERISGNRISKSDALQRGRNANPRFVLRNYLLYEAAEQLEQHGDAGLFEKLEQAMKDPYSQTNNEFYRLRPAEAANKPGCAMLSCSS